MATRDETINLSPFVVGNSYTRPEALVLGGVADPEESGKRIYQVGILEFANAALLIGTLDQSPAAIWVVIRDDPESAYMQAGVAGDEAASVSA